MRVREQFIRPDIFNRTFVGRGEFAVVHTLNGLPPSVREKYGAGVVIKKYNYSNRTGENLNRSKQVLFNHPEGQNLGPLEQAKILQNRQRKMQEAFRKHLPQLIVPSQFIVANDGDVAGIYELQEYVKGQKISDFVNGEFFHFEKEKQLVFINQLEAYRDGILEIFQSFECGDQYLPDIASSNVFVTKEGELRIVDTNFETPFFLVENSKVQYYDTDIVETMKNDYKKKIDWLNEFIDYRRSLIGGN